MVWRRLPSMYSLTKQVVYSAGMRATSTPPSVSISPGSYAALVCTPTRAPMLRAVSAAYVAGPGRAAAVCATLAAPGGPAGLRDVVGRRLDDDPPIVAFAFGVGLDRRVIVERQMDSTSLAGDHRIELDGVAIAHRLFGRPQC